MSLGLSPSTALDDAVRSSIFAGVTYTVSAGNSDSDACQQSPARVAPAITVGATDIVDARAGFSSYGTCLDLFAPGVDVVSALHTSDSAVGGKSGTSMAAPHAAGVAAMHLARNSTATPAQVVAALTGYSTRNMVRDPGSGSPNRLLYRMKASHIAAMSCRSDPPAGDGPVGACSPKSLASCAFR